MPWPPKKSSAPALLLSPSGRSTQHDEDHASRHSDGGDDELTVENLATAAGLNQPVGGDGSGGLQVLTNSVRAVSGTYTGDGTLSQTIVTGLGTGNSVMYVRVWTKVTVDGDPVVIIETTTHIRDDHANGAAIRIDSTGVTLVSNAIIGLGSGNFLVDDDGADDHPNKNGQVYNFLAMGVG